VRPRRHGLALLCGPSTSPLGNMAVTFRVRADHDYFTALMKRYWRQRPVVLRPAVQFAVLPILIVAAWLLAPWQGVDPVTLRIVALGWALLAGPGAYLLTRTLLLQRFRGTVSFGSETVFQLSDDGILVNGPLARADMKWQLYPRAVRFPDGIMLLRPRFLCWLPDSALVDASPADATALVESHTHLRHVA
jgi:hypothetical protein